MDKKPIITPDSDGKTMEPFTWRDYYIKLKEKSKKRNLFFNKASLGLVLIWALLTTIATFSAYSRLSHTLIPKYSPLDSINLALCYGREGICLEQNRYMAPIGAYLMLGGLVLSISLIFSFICLPLGIDKIKLKKSLCCWLAIDLVLILVVAGVSLAGAILVILHDKESLKDKTGFYWQMILWDASLISSPFLVLAFHFWFWRKVCLLYSSIDTSKEAIRGVWSSKI